jgi:hypothetical protein
VFSKSSEPSLEPSLTATKRTSKWWANAKALPSANMRGNASPNSEASLKQGTTNTSKGREETTL